MPVVSTFRTRYSDQKLDILKQHYENLFEFLQKHTEAWAYSRHIFYFPYILCRQMLNLCNGIISLYNQPPRTLSTVIFQLGRKILEIMNNDYMSLAVIADTILQRDGFTLENLKDLFVHWDYDADQEHQTAISFCLSDIPPISRPEEHHQFMNMFRIRDHFLAAPFLNSHDMLRHDEGFLMDVRMATADVPAQLPLEDSGDDEDIEADREVAQINSSFDERERLVWAADFNDERYRYHTNLQLLNAPWVARDIQRNPFRGPTPMTASSNSSNSSSEVGEIPYLPLEEGDFDEFEDYMQAEATPSPASVATQQSEASVDQLVASLGALDIGKADN